MPHRRDVTLTIRCTPEERSEWHALAAEKGTELSEYVRHMLQNRAALSRSEQLDLSYMDDDEVVVAHRLVTEEARRRFKRLRRTIGEGATVVALVATELPL